MTQHKTKPSKAPWIVTSDYGKENVYRLWDKNSNYHDDTSPEVMDANAHLIAAAPELLEAARNFVRGNTTEQAMKEFNAAIAKAEGKN